jgi:hypothetical protein
MQLCVIMTEVQALNEPKPLQFVVEDADEKSAAWIKGRSGFPPEIMGVV